MKNKLILAFIFLIIYLPPSNSQWNWINPPVFDNNVRAIGSSSDMFWFGTGTKIVSMNNQLLSDFDILDSGLNIARAFPISIDASLDSTIWISTTSRVVEFNTQNESWKVHNPSMIDHISSGVTHVEVINQDEVWWCFQGLYEYDGIDWTAHRFYKPDLNMNVNSPTGIKIGPNDRKWVTTNTSICLHDTCYTPAGVIAISELDTLFFDGDTYGFQDANTTDIEFKKDGTPLLIVSGRESNYIKEYKNEMWEMTSDIPHGGFIFDTEMDCNNRIYIAFKDVIAVYSDNSWNQISVDTNEISQIYDIEITANKELLICGFKGVNIIDDDAYGVVGKTDVECNTSSIEYIREEKQCDYEYNLSGTQFELLSTGHESISISLYNNRGQLLSRTHNSKIELENIDRGMYLIYIESEKCSSVIKTIIGR